MVEARTCAWLTTQSAGTVSPAALASGLEHHILPDLGITLLKPLTSCTCCCWLNQLGWRQSAIRKGIYKDGHEREDMIDYRTNVFLPRMAAFEQRVVSYHGPELVRKEPQLQPGEKCVVALWHDKCCMHANDITTSAW
jgi:hypothetical protein